MLIGASLVAGAAYVGIRVVQQLRRKNKSLAKVLAPPAPALTRERAQLMGGRRYSLFPLKNHWQIGKILTLARTSEKSAAEKSADRSLGIALAALALTTIGPLVYAPLGGIGILVILYLIFEIFQYAVKSLLHQRRLTADILDLLLAIGIVACGYYSIAGIGISLMMLGRKLTARTEEDTHKQLMSIFGQQPQFVWLLINGAEIEVPFEQIRVGDILIVSAGQTIPVDGTVISGVAAIDQHMLTGEAQLIERGVGESILASTVLITGKIQIRVEKTGQETISAQIGQMLNQTVSFKDQIIARSLRITNAVTLPTLALGALAFPVAGPSGAMAVLACSAGYNLRLTGPISMLNFLQSASQQGILVKDGRSLELLKEVDTVIFDKTGTLTLEELQICDICLLNGLTADEVLAYAAAAEHRHSHPIAQAIRSAAAERMLTLPTIDELHYEVGYGIQAKVLGGPIIRVGSERYMLQESIPLPDTLQHIQWQSQALGSSLVLVSVDDQVAGAIRLQPTLRAEVRDVIHHLRQRKLTLYILSGDQEAPTRRLAQELGMDHYFANTLPKDKARIIETLQAEGRSICFVGDGINDSIALKKANVSISLKGATTVATDTAQIVLMDDALDKLPLLFAMGAEFNANMRTNLYISIVPAIFCVAGVFVFHWGLLSSFLIYNAGLLTGIVNATRPLISRNDNDMDIRSE